MDVIYTKNIVFVMCFMLLSMSHFARAAPAGSSSDAVLNSLSGAAVSTAQLGALRARGSVVVSSENNGIVANNTISGNSTTGGIMDLKSANNNSGFTTIFQNTGNNSLMQSSTAIYISMQ